jgi:hypothetical protein
MAAIDGWQRSKVRSLGVATGRPTSPSASTGASRRGWPRADNRRRIACVRRTFLRAWHIAGSAVARCRCTPGGGAKMGQSRAATSAAATTWIAPAGSPPAVRGLGQDQHPRADRGVTPGGGPTERRAAKLALPSYGHEGRATPLDRDPSPPVRDATGAAGIRMLRP